MAQSPEYPDLKWIPPKSWTNADRSSVQLIIIHDTEGSAHAQSAEDGAAYDARRTDGTSTHYFVDSNSVVQCVRTNDRAHTARSQGNRRGIQYELCARASWPRSRWLDEDYGLPMLKRAAHQAARDCRRWDIPARKLSPAQVADGAKGFCGHWDITRAFPQDNGSHTDPGANFPWDVFITLVQAELNPVEEEVAITDEDAVKIARAVLNQKIGRSTETVGMDLEDDDAPAIASLGERLATLEGEVKELKEDPAEMADPEQHPIVRAVRYAQDNPAATDASTSS